MSVSETPGAAGKEIVPYYSDVSVGPRRVPNFVLRDLMVSAEPEIGVGLSSPCGLRRERVFVPINGSRVSRAAAAAAAGGVLMGLAVSGFGWLGFIPAAALLGISAWLRRGGTAV